MICSGCQAPVSPDALFCEQCGRRPGQPCPACATEMPHSYAFCGRCGSALAPTREALPLARASFFTQSERRQVTVLFADLSGFTTLAETLDPEELTALLQEYFSELSAEVQARDGWLAKFIGDAIMAVFGAPVAHEDDPVRAVRVALAMHARMRSLNRRLGQRLREPLYLHIGINTGLVVAGPSLDLDLDETLMDHSHFTVIGDAVNIAARLQQVAESEQVIVGAESYEATKWAFEYRPLPPLHLKGKREAVVAYECLGPRAQPLAARGLEGIEVPLLGRASELAELLHAFEACRQGQPQLVSLIGEAGIGKSRLRRELLRQLKDEAGLPEDQCWIAYATDDRPTPFGVARQLFAPAISRAAESPLATRLWRYLDPAGKESDETLHHLDPEQRNQQLYLLAREFMREHAMQQPLLLIVEDLHWADDSSLDLLSFLARRPGEIPLVFLFTQRPTLEGAAWRTVAEVRSIPLAPLPAEIMQAILQAHFPEDASPLPPALVTLLLQQAGGNPFYLEELLRSLIQQRVLIWSETGWRLERAVEQLVVPGSIQGLLLARIDTLEVETRLLLQELSILGQSFSAEMLAHYSALDAALEQRLAELLESQLVQKSDNPAGNSPTYRFQHTLVREVAYESLLRRTRAALHQRAAEVIEYHYAGQVNEHLASLAEHYYRARNVPKALLYLEQAGDQARAMFANAEAASWYRRALELLPPLRHEARGRLMIKLGDVLRAQGLFDQAMERWQQVLDGYEARGEPEEVVALHRRMASALWAKGQVEEAHHHLEQGLRWLDESSQTPEAAALYQEWATQSLHRGDSLSAIAWAERALVLSQQLGAYEQVSLAATTLGVAQARGGAVEEGLTSVEEGLRVASEHDLPIAAGRAAANLAVLYATIDPLAAAEVCEQGLLKAQQIGDVAIQPWFYSTLAGSLHACASDYETATRSIEMAIELDRQLGLRSHLPVPLIVQGQIRQCHGNLDGAEQVYLEALAIAEELADPQLLFPCLEGLGTLYLARGEVERGREWLARAKRVCEAAGFTMQEMVLLPFFF